MVGKGNEHTGSCRMAEVQLGLVDAQGTPLKNTDVVATQTSHDFLFGCAYPTWNRGNCDKAPAFNEIFASLFNYLTTEVALKWRNLEPRKGQLNWRSVDEMVTWAESQGIAVKGHALVWGNGPKGSGTPRWLLNKSKEDVRRLVNRRIRKVEGRYAGRIQYWDVVNEPLHAPWFEEHMGSEYIRFSLQWAREADPAAQLLINECDIIGFEKEKRKFLKLLGDLKEAEAPLNAVGLEAHPGSRWLRPEEITEALDRIGELGLDVHITELTVPIDRQPIKGRDKGGLWTEETQAEYFDMFFRTVFSHPKAKAITIWGLWDGLVWQSHSGLLREDFSKKPAFDALDRLINHEWKTSAKLHTDAEGRCVLSGFRGRYRIEAKADGKRVRGAVHLSGDAPEQTVTLE